MDLIDFTVEYDNLVKHLEETTPSSYIQQPDGAYGWDNVAKYQQMNSQAALARGNSIHKKALELVTAWAKVQVGKDREEDERVLSSCVYCSAPIPLGQRWCSKCAAK